MKVWAIGDVHGQSQMLNHLLKVINRQRGPEDVLVFLGDYIDRGPDSCGVLQLVAAELEDRPNHTVALWGNHEDMAFAAMCLPSPCGMSPDMAGRTWMSNGGKECQASFAAHSSNPAPDAVHTSSGDELMLECFAWLQPKLRLYYSPEGFPCETIFVHAGVPLGKSVEELAAMNPAEDLGMWATFTGPEALLWSRPQSMEKHDTSRLVVCGHTPQIGTYDNYRGFICIDTGAAFGGCLTAVELSNTGERAFWQVWPSGEMTRTESAIRWGV